MTRLSLPDSLTFSMLLFASGLTLGAKMQENADYNRDIRHSAQNAIIESFEWAGEPSRPCPGRLLATMRYRKAFSPLRKDQFRETSRSLTIIAYRAVTDRQGNPDGTINIVAADFENSRNILSYAYRGSNFYSINVRARCQLEL